MDILLDLSVDIKGFQGLETFLKGVRRAGYGWMYDTRLNDFISSYEDEDEYHPEKLNLFFKAGKDFLLLKVDYLVECVGGVDKFPPIVGWGITKGKKTLFIRENIPISEIKKFIEEI